MARTTHDAYTQGSLQTALSTELNSLGNGSVSAASATITNTSNLDLFLTVELVLAAQASARSSDAWVGVYLTQALDGSNFGDTNEITARLVAVLPLDAATTARRVTMPDVAIPPGLFRLFVRNSTGQAFAASGNVLGWRTHSLKSV